jgi:predicted metal-dependent phosphoesterase TrpH
MAKALGYGAIALTDHETLTGLPELFETAKKEGLEAMSGVEFCTKYKGEEIHITGLDFDPNHPAIVDFTNMLVEKRNENTRAIFEVALEKGIFKGVTWDDIVSHNKYTDWYFATQIYYALDAMGIIPLYKRYETNELVFDSPEANAIKLYVPHARDVIKAIKDAGGVAVLAHPKVHTIPYIKDLVDLGLNGIEVSHPSITENDSKIAVHAALEYNLYCSGGTDHTGAMSSFGGVRACPVCNGISKRDFEILKERRLG